MVMEEQPKVGRGAPAAEVAAFKSSKKNTKPKKIPQRGLGVAQLEKLRFLEGLQMNDGASASSSHGFGSPAEPRDASTFFIKPPTVHDLLVATSFDGQQQHRPPPPPPPPPPIFSTVWNSNARLISLAQTIPMVNSVVDHRTEPPSNQNTPNSFDLRNSHWREQEKDLLEMLGNKRPWSSHLAGVCSSASGTNLSKLEFQDVRPNTSTSDLCLQTRRNTENGSFLSLGLVSTPSLRSIDNSQYHYSDFNLQNTHQQNSRNGSSPPNRRSFYNFFLPVPLGNEKMPPENGEALDGDIDLDLKL